MEQQKRIIERRQHPRYYPDMKNQPRVIFIFNNGENITINVVNISRGGLMGYTNSIEHFLGIEHQQINIIDITFPDKLPFRCSGTLLRLQPTREEIKCFCAVKFHQDGFDENQNKINVADQIDKSQQIMKKIVIPDKQFLLRVEKAKNYWEIEDSELESEIRKSVYDSFDDITVNLSLEEKWWFFEILDEMIRKEPNYPEGLKRAYINLCRTGMQQTLGKHHRYEIAMSDYKK